MIKSSFGLSLARAELFSQDENGKRIKAPEKHHRRVRETRPPPQSFEDSYAREEAVGEILARLTDEERAVVQLQYRGYAPTIERVVPLCRFESALDEGWTLVRHVAAPTYIDRGDCVISQLAASTQPHAIAVTGVIVAKQFMRQVLSHDEIGKIVGLTARQVRSRIETAHRKHRLARQGVQ